MKCSECESEMEHDHDGMEAPYFGQEMYFSVWVCVCGHEEKVKK